MLFMMIERFKNRDALAVYRRFTEKGRMAPEGLTYMGSWIEANFDRCFQLMECDDARRLQRWMLSPDPKKALNRHDAKVAKEMMFRSFYRRTRKPVHGAF
jgi:hypothetical protein